ncbi:hypothetical protein KSP39_PZI010497 [Platanthera zijinensis]|uniref:Uncharacterized protein n=1 Tax=Platanthera zijinensis TaxID=2320716 RepID=A0AAP0BIZ7_9ASPA
MAPSLHFTLSMPSSPMGRVEKATSRALLGPNSMLNMDICDSMNSNPWQAKAFVKAVKKRLQHKDSKVHFLALTLLETMVERCGDFLHFQVTEYGILGEMAKMVRKARNMQVRDKILVLLESWQVAFGGAEGKYPQYYYTYAELKRSGVRFPLKERDGDILFAPIVPITNQYQVGRGMSNNTIERLNELMASETNGYSSRNLDLNNVRSVIDLFNNMLQAANPKDPEAIKDEALTFLADQCSILKKNLLQLINSTQNDGILGEALALNDNLQIVLSKYNALVSSLPSPPKKYPGILRSSASVSAVTSAMRRQFDDKDEDAFFSIAKRNPDLKTKGHQEVSPIKDDTNGALILFDPPALDSSLKNEEDMIDLRSPTLAENQSSQTDPIPPPSPPPPSNQHQNPFLDSPTMSNEGYSAYNNYATPWTQPPPLLSQQFSQYSYPTDHGERLNPFLSRSSTQTQYPGSQPRTLFASRSQKNPNSFEFAGKPYKHENLFQDLIELRNPDGSLKSRNISSLWGFLEKA